MGEVGKLYLAWQGREEKAIQRFTLDVILSAELTSDWKRVQKSFCEKRGSDWEIPRIYAKLERNLQ